MKKENFFLHVPDGAELWIDRFLPDDGTDIRGVVQFHIGMEEHTGRYDELGTFFADSGFVFNTYDFRGHGRTAQNSAKNRGGYCSEKSRTRTDSTARSRTCTASFRTASRRFPKRTFFLWATRSARSWRRAL